MNDIADPLTHAAVQWRKRIPSAAWPDPLASAMHCAAADLASRVGGLRLPH